MPVSLHKSNENKPLTYIYEKEIHFIQFAVDVQHWYMPGAI